MTLSGIIRRPSIVVFAFVVLGAPRAALAGDPIAARYGAVLRSFNPGLSAAQSADMATHVLLMSSYYGLDARLLVAIVGVESSWHVAAVSPAGAQGLGQLMPSTASGLGVLSSDAYENLDGTARYLRRMMQQAPGPDSDERYRLALASYNAGPQAVAHFGGIPPFAETQAYVTKVMSLWHSLRTQLPAAGDSAALIARSARNAPHLAVARAKHARHTMPAPAEPLGSVAEFTELDADSMEAYHIDMPQPRKTVGRWFMRALGIAKP